MEKYQSGYLRKATAAYFIMNELETEFIEVTKEIDVHGEWTGRIILNTAWGIEEKDLDEKKYFESLIEKEE